MDNSFGNPNKQNTAPAGNRSVLRAPTAEYALYDYAERLEKHRQGRVALYSSPNCSRANRREHHIRIATNTFESLVDISTASYLC